MLPNVSPVWALSGGAQHFERGVLGDGTGRVVSQCIVERGHPVIHRFGDNRAGIVGVDQNDIGELRGPEDGECLLGVSRPDGPG